MDRILAKLYSRINYERQARVEPEHFKLNNLRALLARLGNPEAACPVIHVAGTKGKGSVATMVANILSQTGRKTGLFTSPHLVRINQRIAIDGQPISNGEFESILEQLDPEIKALDVLCEAIRESPAAGSHADHPAELALAPVGPESKLSITGKPLTFFEVMTAAAFLYYANKKCDAVVLEVGLGGRLDSTNVCQPAACVITNISLDHTRQLGSTIDKIAFEKAGIIKPGVPVVSGELKPLAADVIARVASDRNADLILMDRDFSFSECAVDPPNDADPPVAQHVPFNYQSDFLLSAATAAVNDVQLEAAPLDSLGCGKSVTLLENLKISMLGSHQRSNASMAIATVEVLNLQGWGIDENAVRKGLLATELAGRTQIVQRSPTVVLDVAHNVASAQVLLATLQAELPAWSHAVGKRLVISISKDKDCPAILDVLLPEFDQVVFTKYQENPRAVDPNELSKIAAKIKGQRGLSDLQLSVVTQPQQAWLSVAEESGPDDFICITGSVFLIAELAAGFPPHARVDRNSRLDTQGQTETAG